MMITPNCTDVLDMTDAVATVVLATTDALTFSEDSYLDLKVEKECPKLRYNSPNCATLPHASEEAVKSHVNVTTYQQYQEKEERVLLPWNVDMAAATPLTGAAGSAV